MTKKKLLILVFGFSILFTYGQNYSPDNAGSRVHFTIKNFGINTGGQLSGIKGTIIFDSTKIGESLFNVSVAVRTIDTDNSSRDKHLRGDGYFDEKKYPQITMKSTGIEKNEVGSYIFNGTLNMHGVTHAISFPFFGNSTR